MEISAFSAKLALRFELLLRHIMCARFSLTSPIEAIRKLFGFPQSFNLSAAYNIAPSDQILAVRKSKNSDQVINEAFRAQWGLIPPWAEGSNFGTKLINARIETVEEKPSFKDAFKSKRCLIPANGYFEWKTDDNGQKQPYFIHLKHQQLFAFAGLWEEWISPEGLLKESCTIITCPANKTIEPIHHRMPLTVTRNFYDDWLNGKDANSVPDQKHQESFEFYPVSKAVGNVRADGPNLIAEIQLEKTWKQGNLF
ncbi:SOS response-associated peptidase [Sneathiella limimaris]|uniref:SOS response-associated peptidase n=1 Tax=Sneathiella limimaris TaxID=1964213 RepID=UPI00146C2E5D|nr:SOS response-associated peptidase [Sneathiella limimaris]